MISIMKKDDGYYLNIEGTKSALIYLGQHGSIVMAAIKEEYNGQHKFHEGTGPYHTNFGDDDIRDQGMYENE
jgi:hypothetical protein